MELILKPQLKGYDMVSLTQAIIGGYASYYANGNSDTQALLAQTVFSCLSKQIDSQNYANFYLLIFVDPTTFTQFNDGNTKGAFAKYSFNSSLDDMINASTIMQKLLDDPNYDGYKQYKYICLDLETGQLAGNIGQAVIINEQYEENYSA